ncbi:MAG: type II secretion system ATPase GspE [Planctomycetales bacterium]|nr:type II secretion system ATPase GspE [Planctomycetales bacterium]
MADSETKEAPSGGAGVSPARGGPGASPANGGDASLAALAAAVPTAGDTPASPRAPRALGASGTLLKGLVTAGLLTEAKLEESVRRARADGVSIDHLLVREGVVPEVALLQHLSTALGLRFHADLARATVPPEFVQKVPVQFARAYCLLALADDGPALDARGAPPLPPANGCVRVASAAPFDVFPLDELGKMLGARCAVELAPRVEITSAINRAYQQKADMVDEALEDLGDDSIITLTEEAIAAEDLLDVNEQAPIIKLVRMVLFQALKMRASDIHIQPYEQKLAVRYRIDGTLYDMISPPKKIQDAITSRIKVMGKMDIAERRLPQDGRATIRMGDSEVDLRISSVPTSNGERIVIRLLDKGARLYQLEELGLDTDNFKVFNRLIGMSHGIVLVTGPTGSGKTTTLYAGLTKINSGELNVMTIEDPIEYNLPGISQIQVSTKKGLTFASGLRSLLRQDPDVMMVGEIRDKETATIAIQSSLTGHLVFSTLHTNDAPGAVTRLLDLGVEPYLVASTVNAALAQRLVRVICAECREEYEPRPEELADIGLKLDALPTGKIARGRGCDRCMKSGYRGRTGIYELLIVNDTVRSQVMRRDAASTIKRVAVENGLMTLRMDGASKVARGITTVEEVLAVTQMDVF